ncbi:HPr family phosphocarrier protein [Candidatus Xianfuyuplasma coldseepsis]|uniref:Phosphocarrier protein HPr n=1 Tax=Candidatus Xianfuyuplasma coldseepsis TaxID=2782163 RepID=A0A7L7KVI5_9MOLU|nr:HPr family phosphocarrier protein [Xianfuyuplasma coldseepsis]QMS85768.1 HPr family phosphocarrier protein [Xianfuyuplasma coldseepsis]
MIKRFTIVDEAGLHARPASLLVQKAATYPNDIFIEFNGKRLTLKSIMAVMSLGVPQNSVIAIDVEGENDADIMAALEKVLVDNNLI